MQNRLKEVNIPLKSSFWVQNNLILCKKNFNCVCKYYLKSRSIVKIIKEFPLTNRILHANRPEIP